MPEGTKDLEYNVEEDVGAVPTAVNVFGVGLLSERMFELCSINSNTLLGVGISDGVAVPLEEVVRLYNGGVKVCVYKACPLTIRRFEIDPEKMNLYPSISPHPTLRPLADPFIFLVNVLEATNTPL